MIQPLGCIKSSQNKLIYKLKRSFYGLRQSPHAWYSHIDSFLCHQGLVQIAIDPNVYYYYQPHVTIFLILYIDNLLITSSDPVKITALKHNLSNEFEMKDLDLMTKFLGVQVLQAPHGILVNQTNYTTIIQKYANSIISLVLFHLLQLFRLRQNTNTLIVDFQEYQALIGQLHCLTKTRHDIGCSTSLASCFFHRPQLFHQQAAQNIVAYITKNPSLSLWYPRGPSLVFRMQTISATWTNVNPQVHIFSPLAKHQFCGHQINKI